MTLILRQGGGLIAAGVVGGLGASLLLSRVLASQLYGVERAEPGVLLGATAVVLVSGLLASLVPSLRAARMDPATTLKAE